MSLTVIIATRNQCELLASTLHGLCQVDIPCPRWKVLVVDNGSTDDTRTVMETFAARLPLSAVVEPKAGKNRALNRAIALLDGELALFTDDDVIPERDWLLRMWEAAQACPAYAMFGGHIRGHWPGTANPEGLGSELLAALYTISPVDLCSGPVSPDLVWGPNMAIRTAVFQAGHRFEETIGPDGSDDYPMGSETSFTRHLTYHGHRAWHVASARVQHVIQPYQLERSWILRRARRFGRGECRKDAALGQLARVPTLFGYPRWAVRRLLELRLGGLLSAPWKHGVRRLEREWEYFRLQGYAIEAKMLWKNGA